MSGEAAKKRQYTIVKAAAEMGVSKATARVLLESFVQQGLASKKKETVAVEGGNNIYYTFRPTTKTHMVYTLSPEAIIPAKSSKK